MDSPRPEHSLADDPEFLDSLSVLDRGLTVTSNEPPIVTRPESKRRLLDLFPESPPDPSPEPTRGPDRRTEGAPRPHTYETFYGLSETPFALGSDPRFLYRSVAHDRAAEELLDAIHRRAGAVVVTAPLGYGKTTLCRAVIDRLDRRTLTSFVTESIVSFEQLVSRLLVDFGVLSRADVLQRTGGADLAWTLRSFAASLPSLQAHAVVLIDEAQSVPVAVLRDLAAFAAETPVVQLVLVGQPDLLPLLNRRELKSLYDRIVAGLELGPLVQDEVPGYVMHRLSVAGRQPRVHFDDEALGLLFETSEGNPRTINQLCDRALTRGFDRSASVIDGLLVLGAADELGLSPPAPQPGGVVDWIVMALVGLMLMGLGALAAAWLFSDRLRLLGGR